MGKILKIIIKFLMRIFPAYPNSSVYHKLKAPDVDFENTSCKTTSVIRYEEGQKFFNWFAPHVVNVLDLKDKDVLDLGCGYGGETVWCAEKGVRTIIGIDKAFKVVRQAFKFAKFKNTTNVRFLQGEAENLPFHDGSFDVIKSYDVLEHVSHPEYVLKECERVLRKGGIALLVFPPFYSPWGAHLNNTVTKFPWLNVFFPCKYIIEAANEVIDSRKSEFRYVRLRAIRENERLPGLNGLTIRTFMKMLRKTNFRLKYIKLWPLFTKGSSRYNRWRMKYYAWAFRALPSVPFVNELFTHRVACVLEKK